MWVQTKPAELSSANAVESPTVPLPSEGPPPSPATQEAFGLECMSCTGTATADQDRKVVSLYFNLES